MYSFRLFVCFFWGVYRPTREFFTHMEMSYYRWRVAIVYLCSALMIIEQWRFFSVTTSLTGASFYNWYLRGPVTLTPIAERLAVELSLYVCTAYVCRGWYSNTQPSACRANALTHCATTAVTLFIRAYSSIGTIEYPLLSYKDNA